MNANSVGMCYRFVRGTAVLILVASLTSTMAGAQASGTIVGVVKTATSGLPPIRVTIDQRVCGVELADESILRDASGRLANVVVTLSGVKATSPLPEPVVTNDKCRFVPRVQVARPRAVVRTSSTDPTLHNTSAQQEGGRTLFNVGLPVPGLTVSRPLGGAGLVRISCNVHPWMRGWIVVTDDVSAVTAADGRFVMTDVPGGQYELRFWHESLKAPPQTVTVKAGGSTSVDVRMQ